MTDARFFQTKSLIYEPNLTNFLTNVGTIAAHKPSEFQNYRLRKSPLRGEKGAKISDFGVFRLEIHKNGRPGLNLAGPVTFDPNRCSEKVILIPAVFCR